MSHPRRTRQSFKGNLSKQYRQAWKAAFPAQRAEMEREGVPATVVSDLLAETGISAALYQRIVGVPKAAFARRMRENQRFAGSVGHATLALVELINATESMVKDENFDSAAWVGRWIQIPQPALGGATPAELLDTPSGQASVRRVLGAFESGAYQ